MTSNWDYWDVPSNAQYTSLCIYILSVQEDLHKRQDFLDTRYSLGMHSCMHKFSQAVGFNERLYKDHLSSDSLSASEDIYQIVVPLLFVSTEHNVCIC